jgi:hypothetical protein
MDLSEKKANRSITTNPLIYMAHFEGESSNLLFQTLEEWNEFLKKNVPFFKEVA